jgi:hypothetical protein
MFKWLFKRENKERCVKRSDEVEITDQKLLEAEIALEKYVILPSVKEKISYYEQLSGDHGTELDRLEVYYDATVSKIMRLEKRHHDLYE